MYRSFHNSPTVSIVIPSYNHEKYLHECINSVLLQSFQDFEIIVTDDFSSDNSVELIKSIYDERIHLHCFTRNKGGAATLNNCIINSKGKYIAVLNSDDIFYHNKIEKQVNFLNTHSDIAAVFGLPKIIDENGYPLTNKNHHTYNIFKQKNRSRFEWLNRFFYKGNCLCHPSVLIRRDCYDKIGLLDCRLAQIPDLDFWIRLCLHYEIYILQEYLIKFRVLSNEMNSSGLRPDTYRRCQYEFQQVLNNYLQIDSVSHFQQIFPNSKSFNIQLHENHLIPFFLAKIALEGPQYQHKIFGVNILFNLLENEESSEEIMKRFGFTHKSFIDISGEIDLGYPNYQENKTNNHSTFVTKLNNNVKRNLAHRFISFIHSKNKIRLLIRFLLS